MGRKVNNTIKEAVDKIINGVIDITNRGEYTKFLKFSKYFHDYSFNNIMLIFLQKENATRVAGYKTWEKMNRKVKKGEKGIQIICPMKVKYNKTTNKFIYSKDIQEQNKDDEIIDYINYKVAYVFDISQTEGEEMPLEDGYLNSSNKKEFLEWLKSYSPYPILYKTINGRVKGYWSSKNQHIVLKDTLSIDDQAAVLLHELTHALYDDFNYNVNRNLSETFVESVAFIVADYFGVDTSMCSFNYITYWANGDKEKIVQLGNKIQKAANDFIRKLEKFIEGNKCLAA